MSEDKEIRNVRREYGANGLEESDIISNPFEQFSTWLNQALEKESLDANAMTLSTATKEGRPTARIVLLKGYDNSGFIFYTNYESRKALEIRENPFVSLLFYWPVLSRQVRIEGEIEKISREDSGSYFVTRPFESQIAAVVSPQSRQIPSREYLDNQFEDLKSKIEDGNVPLPEYWGGYKVKPALFEFWQGRLMRLHDRIVYQLHGGNWDVRRLAP